MKFGRRLFKWVAENIDPYERLFRSVVAMAVFQLVRRGGASPSPTEGVFVSAVAVAVVLLVRRLFF